MARQRPRTACALAAAIALATTGWVRSVEAASIAIDAKEAELTELLRLLAAQGGPTLVADPIVAKEKITFAVREVQPQAAVRWLCRACRFVAVSGQGGRLTIGPPPLDKAVLQEYNVASVAATEPAAASLMPSTASARTFSLPSPRTSTRSWRTLREAGHQGHRARRPPSASEPRDRFWLFFGLSFGLGLFIGDYFGFRIRAFGNTSAV